MKHLIILALTLAFSGCSGTDEPGEKTTSQNQSPLPEPTKAVTPIKIEPEAKTESKESTIKKVEETQAVAAKPEPVKSDASSLYTVCASCHGQSAELKALGTSQIIKDWDASKIAEAITGYQNGSYGGPMKGVMEGQVKNLNEAQIKTLADYISKF